MILCRSRITSERFLSLARMADLEAITANLSIVREKLAAATAERPEILKELCPKPRLVAVSKTKPVECILQAYRDGERHFGENYVQELVEKAKHSEILTACPDIKWHFIGHLQRSNVPKLSSVISAIYMIETVDSEKLALCINDALKKKNVESPCNVFVQVNTSGEESKSGVEPSEATGLVKFIKDKCPKLNFSGLMTIGAIDPGDESDNQDFKTLFNLREEVCKELEIDIKDVELSMGMSGDFEKAILAGSTNVRIGSTIFGARQVKAKVVNQ